ncbi:nuclease-related domain-containing protein [Peribacillus kribbensis]|uniref:nuclease-related domain-containing protein n=1 Tax=Peribacillus kribbensis TaxID=356658 RepID=UPI000413FA90|nr:nuclease-related domain-containing protein [Peribacillus kribbensis]
MIVKDRKVPVRILQLEALLRRLSVHHKKRGEIESDLAKRWAGYRGELSVDFHLNHLDDNYLIFLDVNLYYKNIHFQIDSLILTEAFALILEIKNIAGTLFFDSSFHQLIRKIHEKEEGFSDPILQAQRHQYLLSNWLHQNNYSNLPIRHLVVISNPSTIITAEKGDKHVHKVVCHASHLMNKLQQIKIDIPTPLLSSEHFQLLSEIILREQKAPSTNILDSYKISTTDIEMGVICPECSMKPMKRTHGRWVCPECNHQSKCAHEKTIEDYFLLIDNEINNQSFRKFTKISSRHTASRLLKKMYNPLSRPDLFNKKT